jgi:hypothetical protein
MNSFLYVTIQDSSSFFKQFGNFKSTAPFPLTFIVQFTKWNKRWSPSKTYGDVNRNNTTTKGVANVAYVRIYICWAECKIASKTYRTLT